MDNLLILSIENVKLHAQMILNILDILKTIHVSKIAHLHGLVIIQLITVLWTVLHHQYYINFNKQGNV